MFISVVMSVYNETIEEINKSILSILNQTYKNFEFIIVVDNPNNINIINVIKDFAFKDERIKYIINKKNIGLASSLNRGIESAKGKYIVRMDADDISVENRLEKQIAYLIKNPKISLLGSNVKTIDENDKEIRNWKVETNIRKIKKIMKYESCFIHPTVIFKKEIFEKLHGYRDFPCAQDYDFFLRILDAGYEATNLNEYLLLYRVRNNNLTNKKRLFQILLSEYIKKLSKERKIEGGEDSFNAQDIKKIEIIFEREKENFNKARKIVKKYNKNKLLFLLNIPRIVFRSKYYLLIIKNKINILFLT